MRIITKLLTIILLTLAIIGCKNEYDEIGLALKDKDLLNSTFCDTITLSAYSVREDSIMILNHSSSTKIIPANVVLGQLFDPVFGMTQTNIYVQYGLSGNNVNFGKTPILDSLVLLLPYTGYFGDTTSVIDLEIFELNENISDQQAYYNHSTLSYKNENLTYQHAYSFSPKPNTTLSIDTINQNPHIRIRLSDDLGNLFLNIDTVAMKENSSFISFFKGLHIKAKTTSQNGCLMYINTGSSLSNMVLYYHNAADPKEKKTYTFTSRTDQKYFTHTNHDYSLGNDHFKSHVLDGDKTLGKEKLYVQPLAGVRTRIAFPHLKESFVKQNIVINRAELVISNVSSDEVFFFQPYDLSLQTVSGKLLPDDESYTSTKYFGGVYDADTKEYRFRITNYIQQFILGKNSGEDIYLVVKGRATRGNRLILSGTEPMQDDDKRLRLELYYTNY